jgi:methyltransferase family protein
MPNDLFVPPGHYYSPIPGDDEIQRYWKYREQPLPQAIAGIDFNAREQDDNLSGMIGEYRTLPSFPANREGRLRYYYLNPELAYQDAVALRYFLRKYRPRRVIEVGSGHSSACMLDTADAHAIESRFTFIDPNPGRLLENITEADQKRCNVLIQKVQDVDVSMFSALQRNDVLFIDSSHVAKLCSDVNWYFFEIFPRLASGVVIHIHDINYPFTDPGHFVEQGRSWNEIYMLRAFLMYNTAFRIIGWIPFYTLLRAEAVRQMPLCVQYPGGSFWMRKE